jgi:hypothetical protein
MLECFDTLIKFLILSYGNFGQCYRNLSTARTAIYQLENGKRVDAARKKKKKVLLE